MDRPGGGKNSPSVSSKQRLRWTHELHERNIDLQNTCLIHLMEIKLTKKNLVIRTLVWKIHPFQVQRQLQLRIEAQGKYLKKIIEEQQRLSGVLAGSSASDCLSGGLDCDKIDPPTPAPTSELPLQEKSPKDAAPVKSLSLDESLSSPNEPPTPDSGCNANSPLSCPQNERSTKKQRVNKDAPSAMQPGMGISHHILESSDGGLSSAQFGHPL